jgi:hypothetical protein
VVIVNRSITVRILPWLLLAACTASTAPPHRPPAALPPEPVQEPSPQLGLYTVDEALKEALSGTLEYVGTGRWPGIERSFSCAFRNERVVVVNAYCTRREATALRIDIYSPGRGRVRLYAEAKGPISQRERAQYFSFVAATEPPAGPETPVGHIGLKMGFDALRGYEQRRYDAYLPACFAGKQNGQPTKGCLGTLSSHTAPWAAANHDFLAHPSADYHRLVRILRELATRYGKDPR